MGRRIYPVAFIVYALFAIGFVVWFVQDPYLRAIPIVVCLILYLIYKWSPTKFKKPRYARFSKPSTSKPAKRQTTLRVIQGQKSNQTNENPRWH